MEATQKVQKIRLGLVLGQQQTWATTTPLGASSKTIPKTTNACLDGAVTWFRHNSGICCRYTTSALLVTVPASETCEMNSSLLMCNKSPQQHLHRYTLRETRVTSKGVESENTTSSGLWPSSKETDLPTTTKIDLLWGLPPFIGTIGSWSYRSRAVSQRSLLSNNNPDESLGDQKWQNGNSSLPTCLSLLHKKEALLLWKRRNSDFWQQRP